MAALSREHALQLGYGALARWEHDPVTFARDVFGVRCWSRQRELLMAVAEHDRVSVASGHKCTKSFSCALLSHWWTQTRFRGRVVLLAPTYRQISEIVWREISNLHENARWKLGGKLYKEPEGGLRFSDGRQIFGFSTDGQENVAGYSGPILYIADEASGIPDPVHEVISTSASSRVVMISNPTRAEGAFYRSHHSERDSWKCLTISSEEAARENPIITLPSGERRAAIIGMADADWIAARSRQYGTDSYYYDVRVRGVFSRQTDNVVVSPGLVDDAAKRWAKTPQEGRLELGVDVARFGNDDSSIAWRRGQHVGPVAVFHGNDNTQVAGEVLKVLAKQRRPGERPIVRVDTSGLGAGVADILRAQADELEIDVIDVQAQEASTDPKYSRRRDQVWFGLERFLQKGGALPEDDRLHADIVSPRYGVDERGRVKVEGKRELKKRLGRSTDRADAVGLAVFEEQPESNNAATVYDDEFDNMPKGFM